MYECGYPNKTKIKLKKWIGIPELSKYEQYVRNWHAFLRKVKEIIGKIENDTIVKNLNMYILNLFYVKPYEVVPGENLMDKFLSQFEERLAEAEETVKMYR